MFTPLLRLQEQYDNLPNVRDVVSSKACAKPRCIYPDKNKQPRAKRTKGDLKIMRLCLWMLFTLDVVFLSGIVFTRLEMHCKTPFEWACCSSTKTTTTKNLCCHCTKSWAKVDKEKKKLYKTVLPLCEQ